jgi:hypothetical protein
MWVLNTFSTSFDAPTCAKSAKSPASTRKFISYRNLLYRTFGAFHYLESAYSAPKVPNSGDFGRLLAHLKRSFWVWVSQTKISLSLSLSRVNTPSDILLALLARGGVCHCRIAIARKELT